MSTIAAARPRARGIRLGLLCAALGLLLCQQWAPHAQAQGAALEVGPALAGVPLGRRLQVLRDPTGKLEIGDVIAPTAAARFELVSSDAPSFGLTRDTYWLRWSVQNASATPQPWLLEIAYPALDFATLYVPQPGGGFMQRDTGDHLPFARREVAYRNFLFTLQEPPKTTQAYYLRVRTEGSMLLPLKAWTERELFEDQNVETPVVWMFYGLMMVMACYNLFIYFFVRQPEYLFYVLYIVSFGVLAFTLSGHTSQYLVPAYPLLADRIMLLSIGSTFFWICLFVRSSLSVAQLFPRLDRFLLCFVGTALALTLFSLVMPYAWTLRALTTMGAALVTTGPLLIYYCARAGSRPAKLFLSAWGCLILGTILHYTQLLGVLSMSFLTSWGIQIGASLEVVMLSVALADRINSMRRDLGSLNSRLSQHVDDLKLALSRAEQAARAKSEFLATMSHELRTPLNAIINIPQGLAEEFELIEGIRCGQCHALFQLEPGEQLGPSSICLDCHASGALEQQSMRHYVGAPEHTLRYLGTVERAGKHLLQMVDGILDFSKMEAGRVELQLAEVRPSSLLQEAVDTTLELANRAGVRLELERCPEQALLCDPLRVKQVLINLIGNAIKFSDGRGVVQVGADKQDGGHVFYVRDHGIGIAAENFQRIFRSFEQLEQGDTRKYGGTGLGLSISRSLVRMHGGEIWVKSAIGAGATFFFLIPGRRLAQAARELDPGRGLDELHASTPQPAGAQPAEGLPT